MSILGIGLMMVAAIFPVALSQHRGSVYQARATELASKAEAMLRSRVDSNALRSEQSLLDAGLDSPWYLLPFANIEAGGAWDFTGAVTYAQSINGISNDLDLYGADMLSDRFAPLDDDESKDVANRVVWYGFYRRLANGTVNYAVAICRQQRNQVFAEQDVLIDHPFETATANLPDMTAARRFPVPWRITLAYDATTNRIHDLGTGPELLAELAPVGSKIMIHGATYGNVSPVPAGRILTVLNAFDNGPIEVLEDVSDLPPDSQGFFDVWVFPPSINGVSGGDASFGRESPLIDWKVFL
ncbi:MAG: hypothetical protein JXQ75_09685 [Phycisphaerae bacterium]|nr:hypothetical protein [Phycisphaerae bacterium]